MSLALVHLGLGERQPALDPLERADQVHAYRLLEIGVDVRWDPVRSEPRFAELLRRVGLAESLPASNRAGGARRAR